MLSAVTGLEGSLTYKKLCRPPENVLSTDVSKGDFTSSDKSIFYACGCDKSNFLSQPFLLPNIIPISVPNAIFVAPTLLL